MNFSEALHLVKYGAKVRRKIWPPRVWLYLYQMPGLAPILVVHHNHCEDPDHRFPGSDLLADDWEQVDG